MPPINWFGGFLVARSLLQWSRAGLEGDESFLSKINCYVWRKRVEAITLILQEVGPGRDAAEALKMYSWFRSVSVDELAAKIEEAVDEISNPNAIYKFREGEFGTLDFSNTPGLPSPLSVDDLEEF